MENSQKMCDEYATIWDDYFRVIFDRYGLKLNDCYCVFGGKAPFCRIMYESSQQRVLLEYDDGAFVVGLGSLTAQFPGRQTITYDGHDGWYSLQGLIWYKTGKMKYTRKVIRQIWDGKIDQFQFSVDLLTEWAGTILPMFAPGQEEVWRDDLRRMMERAERKNQRWGRLRQLLP